jgi:transcription antitermination factor NusG
MSTPWFILKVKPMAERRASRELRRLGLRVYVPQQTLTRKRKAGLVPKRRPLMAGYVLIRFPLRLTSGLYPMFNIVLDDTRCAALVIDWLRWTARSGERVPVRISDKDVRELSRRRAHGEFDDEATTRARRDAQWAELQKAMTAGTEVRIIDGAFSTFLAIIESIDDEKGAWVRVKGLLGRETRVHIEEPAQQLAPLDKKREAA